MFMQDRILKKKWVTLSELYQIFLCGKALRYTIYSEHQRNAINLQNFEKTSTSLIMIWLGPENLQDCKRLRNIPRGLWGGKAQTEFLVLRVVILLFSGSGGLGLLKIIPAWSRQPCNQMFWCLMRTHELTRYSKKPPEATPLNNWYILYDK